MSSSDEEAASPEVGASSSKDVYVTPMPSEGSESEVEDLPRKKKRTHIRDMREWVVIERWETPDHDEEDIDHLLFTACKKLMEVTRLYRLTTCKSKPDDIFLWKNATKWTVAKGAISYQMLRCPMKRRFNCDCELKVTRASDYVILEMRGSHDENSHASDKDVSKFLKVRQIEAIRQGVRMAPKQSAKHLRRNLAHCSPNSQIDPALHLSVQRKVRRFRAELTSELLDGLEVDDTFGSLVNLVDERWFPTLLEKHNDPECDYHLDLFDVVIIGKDLNPADDIVYMNMSSLWNLLNWLRSIEAGWCAQLNGDVTFKVNRRGVAALTLGINSLGHVSNPLCWALIPETTEGQVTYTGTWHNVRDSVILILKTFVPCDSDCEDCKAVMELVRSQRVQIFMRSEEYKAGQLVVDATLSSKDDPAPALFNAMTQEIYDMGTNETPLHVKIDMWRKEKKRSNINPPLQLSQIKCLFMPVV